MNSTKETFYSIKNSMYCFAHSPEICRELLEGGARIIQLRNKEIDDAGFHDMAVKMKSIMGGYRDAVLIINDRVDIAVDINAHGVHIGPGDEAYQDVIQRVPDTMIVGVSARTPAVAMQAEKEGAAYIGTGSVFPTSTKPDADVIGIEGLRQVAASVNIPVAAIGGISLDNIRDVMETGAACYAVISGINDAQDVKDRVKEFIQLINSTK